MDFLTGWLEELLMNGITRSFESLFTDINNQFGEIVTQVEDISLALRGTHSIQLRYKRIEKKSILNYSEKRLQHFPLRSSPARFLR